MPSRPNLEAMLLSMAGVPANPVSGPEWQELEVPVGHRAPSVAEHNSAWAARSFGGAVDLNPIDFGDHRAIPDRQSELVPEARAIIDFSEAWR